MTKEGSKKGKIQVQGTKFTVVVSQIKLLSYDVLAEDMKIFFSFDICNVNNFWNDPASDPIIHRANPIHELELISISFTFNLPDCNNYCISSYGYRLWQGYQNIYDCTKTRLTPDFLKCLPTTATKLYDFSFLVEWTSSY